MRAGDLRTWVGDHPLKGTVFLILREERWPSHPNLVIWVCLCEGREQSYNEDYIRTWSMPAR